MNNNIPPFLQTEVDMLKSRNPSRNGWYCLSEFVLRYGRHWTPRPLPADIKPMPLNECFKNAADLALGFHRNEYIYCEGNALGIIPVLHAWCVDLDGNVIDPTWDQRGRKLIGLGTEYFGIAFKSVFLHESLHKSKTYGLIDAWQNDWPLLSAPVDEFLDPINHQKLILA